MPGQARSLQDACSGLENEIFVVYKEENLVRTTIMTHNYKRENAEQVGMLLVFIQMLLIYPLLSLAAEPTQQPEPPSQPSS